MMFYSTFMQYFKNDNRGSYSRLIKQYQYWYDKDDRKECQQIFEKVLKAELDGDLYKDLADLGWEYTLN